MGSHTSFRDVRGSWGRTKLGPVGPIPVAHLKPSKIVPQWLLKMTVTPAS